jgi:hypothetical protein
MDLMMLSEQTRGQTTNQGEGMETINACHP